jgi:hypothetical protein
MGYRQTLHRVVNVNGRKTVFAIVKSTGPRMSDADFGVRGGVVGSESWSGGARPVRGSGLGRGVDGAGGESSESAEMPSLALCATGRSGCVQCRP